MTWTITDIGGGLYETVINVTDDTDYYGAFATGNLVLTAGGGLAYNQLNNMMSYPVNTESDATMWNGYGTYVKANDTWYYNTSASWEGIAPGLTDVSGTSVLTLNNLGTGTTTYWGPYADIPLLHVVSTAGTITYDGQIAGPGGIDHDVDGVINVPEPTTMGLLGVGGLVALLRRRK
ncbi:MAG: PEP-CTERM sorting domain-containing protein [Phycisphaerae bacterium]|nr:PEP-CTERM sorting domain-containing protein [Phycisphaerae bacterium]